MNVYFISQILLVQISIVLALATPVKQTLYEEVIKIPKHRTFGNECNNFLCSNRSDYLLQPPGKISYYDFAKLPCFCDEPKCHEFGDCCMDLVTDTWIERRIDKINGISSNLWSCERFSKSLTVMVEQEGEYAWMISSCNSEADRTLHNNCKGNVDEDDYTYIHDIPRVLNNTNDENTLIFRNLYCALCNGYSIEDLIPININLNYITRGDNYYTRYHRRADDKYAVETILNGTYERGKLRFYTQEETFYIEILEYNYIQTFNDGYKTDIRPCLSTVTKTCPYNWKDTEESKICNAYSLFSREVDGWKYYKTPHCAKCNGYEVELCGIPDILEGLSAGLSVMFHFTFSNGRSNIVGKDCSNGYFMDPLYKKCRPAFSSHPKPKFTLTQDNEKILFNETALQHTVDCEKLTLSESEYYILPNHSLYINATAEIIEYKKYKLSPNKTEVEVCSSSASQKLTDSFSEIQGYLTLICTIISLTGLGLHILVLLVLPDLLNLPGIISLATSLTLFFAQALFLWAGSDYRPDNVYLCIIVAVTLHFLFLSLFSWTSVISYDIFKTFLSRMGGRRKSSKLQFIKYFIFATLLPATIVVCSVLFDKLVPDLMISPGYGHSSSSICWFGKRLGLGLFFALPVACLLINNLIMYIIVIISIRKEQKTVSESLAQMNERDNQYTKIDFKVQFGIFNLMGGTWILGIVAGFIDHSILWYLFIIFSGSQGAIIFILFITNPRVWRMLNEKLNRSKKITTSSSGKNTTSKNNITNTATYDNSEVKITIKKE